MLNVLSNHNFHFRKFRFETCHYTNCLEGSPENYIAYMVKGCARIVSAQTTISVREKDVFFIPNNLSYESFWHGENIEFISIGFSNIEADEELCFGLQIVKCDESIKELLKHFPINQESITCEMLSAFYKLLAKLIPYLQRHEAPSKKDIFLKEAQNYIKDNINCTMADVARHCYISEAYLFAIFKEKAGYTPNDYRLKCKCVKANEYLVTTDKTIEEISEQTGFSSAAHFRRTLKKYTGMTPREIRKRRGF